MCFYIISPSLERFLSYLQKQPFLLRTKVSLSVSPYCPMPYSIHFPLWVIFVSWHQTTFQFLTHVDWMELCENSSLCSAFFAASSPNLLSYASWQVIFVSWHQTMCYKQSLKESLQSSLILCLIFLPHWHFNKLCISPLPCHTSEQLSNKVAIIVQIQALKVYGLTISALV